MTKTPWTEDVAATLQEYGLALPEVSGCVLCQFESGEIIFQQDTLVNQLYLVVDGKVKVCTMAENGRDIILCYYISSGILGDIELMQTDKTAPATTCVALPSRLVRIPFQHNLPYLFQNTAFMKQLARGLATKLRSSGEAYVASALYSGEARLCSYILMAESKGLFTEMLSDVAPYIGVSYRHLFRVLNQLCQKGVLERRKSGFQILDKAYLLKKCNRHE